MKLKFLNTLFIKMFIGFWLLIALFSSFLTLLPDLDKRTLNPITPSELRYLKRQKQKVENFVKANPDMYLQIALSRDLLQSSHQIYITTSEGRLINQTTPIKMQNFITNSRDTKKPLRQINSYKTYLGPIHVTLKDKPYYVYISYFNQQRAREVVERLIDNPLLLLLAVLFISTPVCAYLSWYLTYPLEELRLVANDISKGKLETKFPDTNSSEEFNELNYSMQRMVTSLNNMLTNQQRLLSDLSHELRSPLTRLCLSLAIARKQEGENKALQRIATEADRMEVMIASMLDISRIQLDNNKLESIPIAIFFEDLFLDAEFEANENGKTFTFTDLFTTDIINNEISVFYELAYRAIENIIRNAIKYAKSNILAEIIINENDITISISNDGPLLPEHELANILRPFYRLNESRDRESGGAGLGLSIAENAMLKHAGKFWAENKNNRVYMHLQFPIVPE